MRGCHRPGRGVVLSILLLAGMTAVLLSWLLVRRPSPLPPVEGRLTAPDPRLSYDGPYRNVHPDVDYVGDAACAKCHPKESATYRRHPMARTLTPVELPEVAHSFDALGKRFQVWQRDGQLRHTHAHLDGLGQEVYRLELTPRYAIGSGERGQSYLAIADDGILQSPITWYPQKRRWDLSPGFTPVMLAGRNVGGPCLFCHSNGANEEVHSERLYREPLFPNGHGIGCERCHGPGGAHVKEPRPVASIVNPAHLSPSLREAICWQCHLEGAIRVLKRGRQRYDFRPGMPLEDFVAVYHDAAEASHDHVVNHVEQMVLSRCYQKSAGPKQLGCVSCHDPHEKPAPAKELAHYRAACLKCHQVKDCAQPQSRTESCVGCHMPRYDTSDVPHVSSTNHRIVRQARPRRHTATKRIEANDLVSFFAARPGREAEERRDRAVASAILAQEAGRMARPLLKELEEAAERDPGDLEARTLFAMTLLERRQPDKALTVFEDVLRRQPNDERGLIGAAKCYEELEQLEEAREKRRLLVQLHPRHAGYRYRLVELLARLEAWADVEREARAWLVLDPGNVSARTLLRDGLRRLGQREAATEQQRILEELRRR